MLANNTNEPVREDRSAPPRPAGKDAVTVTFGVDPRFIPHMAATIASIVAHAPDTPFHFIVLHTGADTMRQAQLEGVAPRAAFTWIEITDGDVPGFRDRAHFTRAILFRLGLERLAPADCRRLIYLDSDVIVLRDLRELWEIDLGDCPMGAVPDTFAKGEGYLGDFARRWNLSSSGEYMNSGVLLIDLDRVRREKAFSRAIDLIAQHGDELFFPDQDALNIVLWGRCKVLPNEWNVLRNRVVRQLVAIIPPDKRFTGYRPAIVHFSDQHKPWLSGSYHPWAGLYWRYLSRTPFLEEVASANGFSRFNRLRLSLRWFKRHPVLSRLKTRLTG